MRYLLFNSACSACDGAAQEIGRLSDGWLVAKSLHDPEMRALLDEHQPGWTFRPTLIELNQDRVIVRTGMSLSLAMLRGLGPVRSRRVLALTVDAVRGADGISRRSLLGTAGATVALLGLGAAPAVAAPASLPTGAALDALAVRASKLASVRSARAKIAKRGYRLSRSKVVAVPNESGGSTVMFFYGHKTKEETHAAMVMVDLAEGDSSTRIEYASADPSQLFAAGSFNPEAITARSTTRSGGMTAAGAGTYISCLAFCVGANCQANAYKCRHLKIMYLVLACMVAVCGTKVKTCHTICKSKW